MSEACLCVFAKAPVSGKVKTRLLPALDESQSCHVHETLIRHCLMQTADGHWQRQLWSTDTSHPFVKQCAEQFLVSVHAQRGHDLGSRMAFAVRQSLENFPYVIIIGSDCPDLDAGFINEAIDRLKAGSDVVLGPATDGGYVLIGLSAEVETIFNDIEWGSDQVLEVTRSRLQKAGLTWSELETRRDIDRPEDLYYLQQQYPALFHSIGVSLSLPQSDQEPG